MTDQTTWNRVDHYLGEKLLGSDDALESALAASDEAGLPAIAVSPPQGRLLELIARSIGARKVLEIGTLGRLQHHLPRSGRRTGWPRHLARVRTPARRSSERLDRGGRAFRGRAGPSRPGP